MNIFKKPNLSNNWKCSICGTNEEKEVVLIRIHGTEEEGICQARQYHLDCIDLMEIEIHNKMKALIMQYDPIEEK